MMSFLLDQRKNDIFNRSAPQVSGPQQMQRPMAMPSGGPNVQQTKPPALDDVVEMSGQLPPMDIATAIACGIPPSQINRGPGGNAQNNPMPPMGGGMGRPMPPPGLAAMFPGGATPPPMGAGPSWASMTGNMGGGMAPSMPNAVDQGLGMQQMNFGNPMGGMNNWFSNFAAPRPMPAPAPAAPAPMMPMKGMFGVR